MFDLSLAEILLVVVVAVIFIGPKELPVVVRACMRGIAQLRRFAGEVRGVFDEVVKESGVDDLRTHTIIGDDGQEYEAYDVSEVTKKHDAP